MSKSTLWRFVNILLLIFMVFNEVVSQSRELSSIRMMFYNVENFFDIYDDSLTDDNDFLPHGVMRWNYDRYIQKVNSIYKVITAAGEWSPPSIIGFCEVEKRSVLEDLITGTYLSRYDYGIVHEESPDPRGIDVCLIYRKDQVSLIGYQYLLPEASAVADTRTRSVLFSRWIISYDTINLFLNHWPSRRGGVLAGEATRKSIAQMVKGKVDSILKSTKGQAKIIIAGDFNCSPADQEISLLLKPGSEYPGLINLAEQYSDRGEGTYRYSGLWDMFDQVIVSEWLLNCNIGVNTSKELFRIFRPDFVLSKDAKYPGVSPFPTYLGYKYNGGYSDHLAVLLDLKISKFNQKR